MAPLPFHETFRALHERTDVSLAALSRLTKQVDPSGRGLSNPTLSNLMNANVPPSMSAMEVIASALRLAGVEDAEPTDFAEYRLALVRCQLDERRPDGGLSAAWDFFERIEGSVGSVETHDVHSFSRRKLAA